MVATGRNSRWQEMDRSDVSLEKLARHFKAHNRLEGKSLATVYWYQ